jgi:WhiB family redox-sensing transcriptional regulator
MEKAACKGRTDLFYPKYSERPEAAARRVAKAKTVCSTCPVLEQCRDMARSVGELGVWGGETDEERWALGFSSKDPVVAKRIRTAELRRARRERNKKNRDANRSQ